MGHSAMFKGIDIHWPFFFSVCCDRSLDECAIVWRRMSLLLFFPSSFGERGDRIAARHPLCIVVIFSVLTGRSGLRSETTLHKLMEQSIHPSVVVVMAVYAVKHAPSPPLIIHIYSPLFVGLSVCLLADCCRGKGMECRVLGAPRSRAFRTAPSRYSMTFA